MTKKWNSFLSFLHERKSEENKIDNVIIYYISVFLFSQFSLLAPLESIFFSYRSCYCKLCAATLSN